MQVQLVEKLGTGFLKIINDIKKISGLEIFENQDLKKFSTMRLESKGNLVVVKTIKALSDLLKLLNKENQKFHILGWGANQLLAKEFSVPVIKLEFGFDKSYLSQVRDEYILPASVSIPVLSSHATKFGLKGWEVFTGVPASLGGAIFMNAGTNLGEIGDLVKLVKIMTNSGDIKERVIQKGDFSYRKNNFLKENEIIVEATLVHHGVDESIKNKIKDYLALRNKTQPLKEFTCGCIFKNYYDESKTKLGMKTCRAGQAIDIIGLKGFQINSLRVSPKHANFMENLGDSNIEDVSKMINKVKKVLNWQFGVDFETEVKIPKD